MDLHRIQAVIKRTRRRLRFQRALETVTTAAIAALGGALVVLWLYRMELLSGAGSLVSLGVLAVGVAVAGLISALRPPPAHVIASRIDRASGLADRLGTACDFDRRLREGAASALHPDAVLMMRAAVADGLRAVDRARVPAAAPLSAPRDLPALGAFVLVGGAILLLSFGPERRHPIFAIVDRTARQARAAAEAADHGVEADDLDYSHQLVAELMQLAETTHDQELMRLAEELEKLLAEAERGRLPKEELLARMQELDERYLAGADADADAVREELKDSGKTLAKEPMTRRVGEALAAGDLEAAAKELSQLADRQDKGELTPEQQRKLAEALEQAARKHEEKAKRQEEQTERQIAKAKDEIRRLEKQREKNPRDEHLRRRLEKKQRELAKLERERKEKREQAQERSLERLHRNIKKSAENLRNRKPDASKDMREAARDARRVEDEIRKLENQKKTRSQLADLKDAIRRAKPKKGNRDLRAQARAERLREWERRAGGGKGDPTAWRVGLGRAAAERGRELGQGDPSGEPGSGAGDEHDPNLMGDPTKLASDKKDERLAGVHGEGPSRRETVLTSAKKGFASTSYKRVYADYRKIVEEVMSNEKVPQGYRYYVKRYFQRIKPHVMD